ncbi:hypothetical protein OH76DRAFT_1458975 [Lentinus brumalis]|uniref:CxC1-like cysteine cluster associated with KDZ transposases domain-containing protein n=1 Tax=Lentinus brumalis TaxID=2498619 RepID=A0A371CP50_9APHY|nr:hypothetical protein OH76DRAFT_1458975 [Polyporus brumalis]
MAKVSNVYRWVLAYGKHTLKQAQEMRADNTKPAPAAPGFSFDLSSENPLDHDQSMQDLDAVRSQLGAETQATDIGEDMVHAIRDFMYLGDGSWDVALDIIDIISLERRALFRRSATQRTAIAIAESGYLPTSPQHPTLAISFRTLEYFRRLRLRKSSYSVEAFAKTMCDLYGIPYRRRWRTAISNTYDVYLAILRVVDKRLMAYLGRDTANWRVKHACTACNFKLEGEEDLGYDRICCMDGNNSLKRIAKIGDREIADKREFTESDYYLLADYVDQFKDEVKRTRNKDAANDDDDGAWTDVEDSDDEGDAHGNEGDPTDFAGADDMLRQCTKNWKSAARDETKKMWGIFDETGIFAAACRHGFILWVMDMVKSGELAKYALAIVAKALDVFEDRILFGYDIGCTFNGTILASSLGPKFTSRGCRCCVNAFHGYSHSHSCQTINHPSVIKGAGLDDMEGMERIFSSSNELAPITRYSSKYHRRMNIDRHLYQWDEDKYANLATMLYNNYKQALDILANDVPVVDEWLVLNNCTLADLENWDKEEKTYFATVGKVTEADAVALEYVARLQELWRLQDRSAAASSAFVTSIPEDYALAAPKERTADAKYRQDVSQTLKKETEMRLLREKRDAALRDVIALELQLGLDSASRWTPTTPKFVETAQFLAERDYHVALEQLQRLVVQRLFELHTMNISHTAYKIRTQIAKSLQRRSKAIRAAVNAYNKAAAALKNPRPPLDWSKVTHYAFLEEFELLRDTRNDLAGKRWAETTTRPIIKKARRIARAREEIRRCNIEVRRVHSAIIVENEELETAVRKSRDERNPIWGALVDYATRRRRVNARLLAIIGHIYDLPGFSGHRTPGVRKDLGAAATVLEFATNLT